MTAIILSGGKSSRMGTEKGLVELNGKCLIEYVIEAAKNISDEIIIVANNNEYKRFGYRIYSDLIKNCGPMGGIYTGLFHSQTEKNLVLSCDIPFVSSDALKFIIKNSGNSKITVPKHNNKIEPLCAVYSKSCAGKFKTLILKNELKMTEALKKFSVKYLDVSKQKFYSEKLFHNINSKKEITQV